MEPELRSRLRDEREETDRLRTNKRYRFEVVTEEKNGRRRTFGRV